MSLAGIPASLLAHFGQTLTIEKGPASGGRTAYTATGAVLEIESRAVDGVTVLAGDKAVWIGTAGITGTPEADGQWWLKEGSRRLAVVRVRSHRAPSGTVVAYELLVRQSP